MATCAICGNKVPKPKKKYCSTACIRKYQAQRFQEANAGWNRTAVPSATTGAINELRVAADLLAKGYEVFRSLTPNCSCDLAILKDRKLFRMEVRSGYYYLTVDGEKHTTVHFTERDMGRSDIRATTFYDKITYDPDLP